MGRISDDAIRAVRERASLVEVVSDVVTLRRRGRSVVGLCPFHTEKTPSFTVSEERGRFHCFGCGEDGDVFAFVMKTESLSFPEAIRRVAERFGVPLPEEAGEAGRSTEPLGAANAAAAAFFQAELAGAGGARARAYLRERGLTDETVRRFGLGYAPGAGDALACHLRARRLPVEHALAAGLVLRRDRPEGAGGVYDRFRDRVMFPIADRTGKVIAFGGRVLPGRPASGDPPPKYLNSPETPLFRKGHTLYGLAQAREAIRDRQRVIVVEGYLDVIALAQAGIGEVVAPLGTALTVDQLRILRRLTDAVIACFDGDPAGRRAAARSFPLFLEAGLWGRGAFLPAGDDPDSFVRARGGEAFEACVAAAVPLVEAFLEDAGGADREAVGRRAEAAREVARILKRVSNPFEYDVLARLAADRLGVREEVLRAESAPEVPPPASLTAPVDRARDAEEQLVELMAADPLVTSRVRAANIIAEFEHPAWRRTAETLAGAGAEAQRTEVVQGLPRELRDRVARRLLGEIEDEDREREVSDCIARVRERRQGARLLEEMRAAEARGDAAAFEAAWRQLQSLRGADHTQKVRT
jgi:DNA primase